MKYLVGQNVKIISMEKVRSYPKRGKDYKIGNAMWLPLMNPLAGTTQKIVFVGTDFYDMDDIVYTFSPEMIEGPAEVDKIQEQILALKIHTAKIIASGPEGCRKYLASLELEFDDNPADPVEQEGEGQEENIFQLFKYWCQKNSKGSLADNLSPFFKYICNEFTITRKNNPQ
jgi:hypothetical protein